VCDIKHLHRVGTVGNVILAMCAAVGFGPDSYRGGLTEIFIESFLARAFGTQSFSLTICWDSGTLWRALEVGGMCGLTMCGDAGLITFPVTWLVPDILSK